MMFEGLKAFWRARMAAASIVLSLAVLALGLLCPATNAQTTEWTWMGGPNTTDAPGVYPASPGLSTASTANIPGSRYGAVSWTDKNGNLWLFGGQGYDSADNEGYLNDLWEFNSTAGKWAWMGGSNAVPASCSGFTGTCGQPGALRHISDVFCRKHPWRPRQRG